MKAITNTDIIESRTKWARRVAPFTMLFLIGGLITNFMSFSQPDYFQYTIILLALGFIFATISSHLVNRWVREPRADQVLTTTLKKFGNDYVLFNYTGPTSHVLLTPSRLYVIVVKHQDGQITVNGRRLSRKFSLKRLLRFFAEEGLGVPFNEALNGVDKLRKFLEKNLADEEIPEIASFILFTNKEVELSVNNPVIPVLRSNQLKTFLREHSKNKAISASERNTLTQIVGRGYQAEKTKR